MKDIKAKSWSEAKAHFGEGARRVVCSKIRKTADHCPDRKMEKTCHTIEEAYNFFYGRKLVKQVRKDIQFSSQGHRL